MKTRSLGHVVKFGEKGCVITNNQKKFVALDVKKIPFLNCSIMLSEEEIENVHHAMSKRAKNINLWPMNV
jgi:hypothetical protein